MDLVVGIAVLAATTLVFCYGFGAHRRTVPARWTRWPGASMLFCVALTMAAPVGIGLLVKAVLDPGYEWATLSWPGLLVALALVALAVIAVPALVRPGRRAA